MSTAASIRRSGRRWLQTGEDPLAYSRPTADPEPFHHVRTVQIHAPFNRQLRITADRRETGVWSAVYRMPPLSSGR